MLSKTTKMNNNLIDEIKEKLAIKEQLLLEVLENINISKDSMKLINKKIKEIKNV